MKQAERKLVQKRQALLERLTNLSLLVQGSYLERFSTCSRENCECHRGKKHGPRSYLVVYREKKQRQIYVPQAQREAIRQGIRQHEQLQAVVKEITSINLELMRAGVLTTSAVSRRKGGTQHD